MASPRPSIDKKKSVELVESAAPENTIVERFPLLIGKSEDELAVLNKAVLKKLDFRFLPTITVMLLMK